MFQARLARSFAFSAALLVAPVSAVGAVAPVTSAALVADGILIVAQAKP